MHHVAITSYFKDDYTMAKKDWYVTITFITVWYVIDYFTDDSSSTLFFIQTENTFHRYAHLM